MVRTVCLSASSMVQMRVSIAIWASQAIGYVKTLGRTQIWICSIGLIIVATQDPGQIPDYRIVSWEERQNASQANTF